MAKLSDLASTVRSKNAGVNQITFDIIFPSAESYRRVLASAAITKESVAKLFVIPHSRISDFVTFDLANAIKFTIYRLRPSGSPGESRVMHIARAPGATVNVIGLNMSGGHMMQGDGGAIFLDDTSATLNILYAEFTANEAFNGAGIRADGTLNIVEGRCPAFRRAEIVALLFEATEPGILLGAEEVRFGRLGEVDEVM